jgi:uncharacterized repeat protein (TIGR03803 family)
LLAILTALLFAASLPAGAQTEWVIHTFDSAYGLQGAFPMGNLVADAAGNLYGTAEEGGSSKWGIVYELVRPVPPETAWTETVIHNFTNGAGGAQPVAGLIFDAAGNLYGTTVRGSSYRHGIVFELLAPSTAGGKWSEMVLHSFDPASGDGSLPVGELALDGAGNLYGVTDAGGAVQRGHGCANIPNLGCGAVFQLSPPAAPGGAWTETILHSFNNGQGAYPEGGAILDANGVLYGTTYGGGLHGEGVIYRLTPPAAAGGAWNYRVLHAFTAGPDGASPRGALVLHGSGVLYGTTTRGGAYGGGTVFELVSPAVAGGAWTENVIYSFGSATGDDGDPSASVIFGSAGNIFGTTIAGGAANGGAVFQLTAPSSPGGDWTETILHSFGEGNAKDGSSPSSGVILKNGVLYGVTQSGGTVGEGTVYAVTK